MESDLEIGCLITYKFAFVFVFVCATMTRDELEVERPHTLKHTHKRAAINLTAAS